MKIKEMIENEVNYFVFGISEEKKAAYAEYKLDDLLLSDGITEDTEVEFLEDVSLKAGTDYRQHVYAVVGTDDAIVISRPFGTTDAIKVVVENGYFAREKEYAHACGRAAHKNNLPFEVVLATTPELAHEFAARKKVALRKLASNEAEQRELCCGINRKKAAVVELLGLGKNDECSDAYRLCLRIEKMGQKNISRIAGYLLSAI